MAVQTPVSKERKGNIFRFLLLTSFSRLWRDQDRRQKATKKRDIKTPVNSGVSAHALKKWACDTPSQSLRAGSQTIDR
jgi:hypothetical protein